MRRLGAGYACVSFMVLASVCLAVGCAFKTEKKEAAHPPGIMTFGLPSAAFQHYSLAYTFPKQSLRPFVLKKVSVNGEEVRDFSVAGSKDSTLAPAGYKRRYAPYGQRVVADGDLTLVVRCNWRPETDYILSVEGLDDTGQPVGLEARGTPHGRHGYWNPAWRYCATVVLRESQGVARVQEPVHLKLGLYADRLTHPSREIRVVELNADLADSAEGPYREVVSQVYDVAVWNDRALVEAGERDPQTGERIVRYLATTTLGVAFFADVPARSAKIYLLFYGNPDAPPPGYATDLKISGPEIGQVVENDLMRVDLDDSSGSLFGVFLKQGKNVLLEHRLETNGAVHWNPDAYSPPSAWVHASDWKAPAIEQVTGPVFHMTRRRAPLPDMESVTAALTYIFYAGKPFIVSSSLISVTQEFYGQALRNGEIVFNHEQLNAFAYQDLDGAIMEIPMATAPAHPEHAVDIPFNVPWMAFINDQKGIGFAALNLELTHTNARGGLSEAEQPYIYVANGPWIYFSRALNYSFGSNNTSRMIRCAEGSLFYEKTAYMPFVLGAPGPDKYRMIAEHEPSLRYPLQASCYLDTDIRNNAGWVVPILTQPFDEGVRGAVGQDKKN